MDDMEFWVRTPSSSIGKSEAEFWLYHFAAMWPWASDLTQSQLSHL